MAKTKRIMDFRVNWVADHEQYYQGHGIAGPGMEHWTHSATGNGNTLRDAFEDALEGLAQQDIDVDGMVKVATKTASPDWFGPSVDVAFEDAVLAELTEQVKEPEMLDWDIADHRTGYCECKTAEQIEAHEDDSQCAVCAGEWYFYVNVDVRVEREEGE